MEFAPLGRLPILHSSSERQFDSIYIIRPLDTAFPQTQKFHSYEYMLKNILDKFTKGIQNLPQNIVQNKKKLEAT